MKKIIVIVLVCLFFISCGGAEIYQPPKDLVFSETTYLFKIYYPQGWESTTGVNGSCTVTFEEDKITIPFIIALDDTVKEGDLDSLGELKEVLTGSNPSGTTEVKTISGRKSLWWYFDVMGVELSSFMLPLDGVMVTGMVWPRQNKNLTPENLEHARMIIDSFRLVE